MTDPISWIAVALSALLAWAVGLVWYGMVFRRNESGSRSPASVIAMVLLQGVSALMLGHMFARIGAEKLAAKPWLYWMQSGGVALTFIGPAILMTHARNGLALRKALVDAAYWLVVYLLTGTLFWVLS